jgi:hypothetical protein
MLEEVWRGRSAISKTFERVTLTRWRLDKEFKTGNIVCMTRKEVQLHDKLTGSGQIDPDSVYEQEVVEYVATRMAMEEKWNRQV